MGMKMDEEYMKSEKNERRNEMKIILKVKKGDENVRFNEMFKSWD